MMAHDDAREGKWMGNWRMEWVDSTLHTNSEHAVSSNTTADAHTSAASSRQNWRPSADLMNPSVSLKEQTWFLLVWPTDFYRIWIMKIAFHVKI